MVMQDKIKTAKVVMGRAVQVQEHHMMQEREREYNQALDQTMDQQRLQVLLTVPFNISLHPWVHAHSAFCSLQPRPVKYA